eukprot:397141_1
MGSKLTQILEVCCDDNPVTDHDKKHEEQMNIDKDKFVFPLYLTEKLMLPYINMVHDIDERERKGTFNIEDYRDDTAQMLYLFHMEMSTYKPSSIVNWRPYVLVGSDHLITEQKFDASYPDPFEHAEQELNGLNKAMQKAYVEKIW